jgi:hypothetical protein
MSSIDNSTLVLEEERKKVLQEAIKNLPKGDTFSNPTVLPNDYVKRMENERANLIKAQQEIYNKYEEYHRNISHNPRSSRS